MSNLNLSQIHHYAYVVDALDAAARRLHAQFGAGPFFYIEQVPVTDVTSRGEPAEYIHSAAGDVPSSSCQAQSPSIEAESKPT